VRPSGEGISKRNLCGNMLPSFSSASGIPVSNVVTVKKGIPSKCPSVCILDWPTEQNRIWIIIVECHCQVPLWYNHGLVHVPCHWSAQKVPWDNILAKGSHLLVTSSSDHFDPLLLIPGATALVFNTSTIYAIIVNSLH